MSWAGPGLRLGLKVSCGADGQGYSDEVTVTRQVPGGWGGNGKSRPATYWQDYVRHGSVKGKARAQGSVQFPGHCRSPCKHHCLSQIAVGTAAQSFWEMVLEKGLQSSILMGSGPDGWFPFRCSIKVSSSNQLAPSLLCAQVFYKEELLLPTSCSLDLNRMGGLSYLGASALSCPLCCLRFYLFTSNWMLKTTLPLMK